LKKIGKIDLADFVNQPRLILMFSPKSSPRKIQNPFKQAKKELKLCTHLPSDIKLERSKLK
jgi:hypothetical protein